MPAIIGVFSALKTGRRMSTSDRVAEGEEPETNILSQILA